MSRFQPVYSSTGQPARDFETRVNNAWKSSTTPKSTARSITTNNIIADNITVRDLFVTNEIHDQNATVVHTLSSTHTPNTLCVWDQDLTTLSNLITDSAIEVTSEGGLIAPSLTTELLSLSSDNVDKSISLTSPPTISDSYNIQMPPNFPPSIQYVMGVEQISGSTVQTRWMGIPGSISTNMVTVCSDNPSPPGQYATIQEALTFVSTQSPSVDEQFVIRVMPGVYHESNLIVPSYVSIQGVNAPTCIVEGSNNNQHIFILHNYTSLYQLTINGPTSSGYAGIYNNSSNWNVILSTLFVQNCHYGLLLENNSSENDNVFVYSNFVIFNDNLQNAIFMNGSFGTGHIFYYSWSSQYYAGNTTTITGAMVRCKGQNVLAQILGDEAERDPTDTPSGTCFQIEQDAKIIFSGGVVLFFDTGVFVPDDSTSPNVKCDIITFTGCNVNIDIANPLCTGYFNGESPILKIIYPIDGLWFVSNHNPRVLTVSKTNESDFLSIQEALDSITDPTGPDNSFAIQISPGVYAIDATIVMKPYVQLIGDGQSQTILEIADNVQGIEMKSGCALQNITLQGTGNVSSEFAVIYFGDTPFNSAIAITQTLFRNLYRGIYFENQSVAHIITSQMNNCAFIHGFHFDVDIDIFVGGQTLLNITNASWFCVGTNNTACIRTQTDNPVLPCSLTVSNCSFRSNIFNTSQNGTAINIETGDCDVLSSSFSNYEHGIVIPNTACFPVIHTTGLLMTDNTNSIEIENPNTVGSLSGVVSFEAIQIVSSAEVVTNLNDPSAGGLLLTGPLFQGPTFNTSTDISTQINQSSSLGLIFGGTYSYTNLLLTVQSGSGYVMINVFPNDNLSYIEFKTQSLTLPANTLSYIFITNNGLLNSSVSSPNTQQTIFIASLQTDSTQVIIDDPIPLSAVHTPSALDIMLRNAIGSIFQSGGSVQAGGISDTQFSVTAGSYYYGRLLIDLPSKSLAQTYSAFYRDPSGLLGNTGNKWTYQTGLNTVPALWDNGSGVLQIISSGFYVKHVLYSAGLIYGDQQFASLAAAETGPQSLPPPFFNNSVISVATLIIDDTGSIVTIQDIRPTVSFRAGNVSSTSNHSALSNLDQDDHPQYLLVDGTRAMTGSLNMGSFNVNSAGTYNSVTVQTHASRHLPGGADPLPVATPVAVGLVLASGVAESFSRSDHVHTHGLNHAGGNTHALADETTAGFMSSAAYTQVNGATSNDSINTLVQRSGSGQVSLRGMTLYNSSGSAGPTFIAAAGTTPCTLTWPINDGDLGQVLTTDGNGVLTWSSPFVNPMTNSQDLVVGGTGGVATRLAVGAAGNVLSVGGDGQVAWSSPVSTTGPTGPSGPTGTSGVINPMTTVAVYDDFVMAPIVANQNNSTFIGGDTLWWQNVAGLSPSQSPTTVTSNEVGVVQFTTSNFAGAYNNWSKPSTTIVVGGGQIDLEARVYLITAPSSGNDSIGFGLNTNFNASVVLGTTNCIVVRAFPPNPSAWSLVTSRNGGYTINEIGTPPNWATGVWTHLRISINATGTSVSLFVNEVLATTNTTNISTSTLYPVMYTSNSTGTVMQSKWDYWKFYKTLTTTR